MPVRVVAPTIMRCGFQHLLGGTRPATCLVDVSIDEFGVDRETAVHDVADNMCHVWQPRMLGIMSPAVSFVGMHWIDLDSLEGISGFEGPHAGDPTVGGATGVDTEPPQVCYLVHKNCSPNRSQKNGRMYVPGVFTDRVNNDGTLTAGSAALVTARTEQVRTDILALSTTLSISTVAWRVVHVHKPDKTNPTTWSWSSSDVKTTACDARVATQRRRLRG